MMLRTSTFGKALFSVLTPLGVKETKLDLSSARMEYMPDTDLLEQRVPQLAHGLDQFLKGKLVMGNHGVGKLPALNEHTTNESLLKISGYIEPSEDRALL